MGCEVSVAIKLKFQRVILLLCNGWLYIKIDAFLCLSFILVFFLIQKYVYHEKRLHVYHETRLYTHTIEEIRCSNMSKLTSD